MRGLTVSEPWASLIAYGNKRWETRSWATNYRGVVLIHAAKSLSKEARRLIDRRMAADFSLEEARDLAHQRGGKILAVATLMRVFPASSLDMSQDLRIPYEFSCGDFSRGRQVWELHDVVPLVDPVPWRGALGLWRVPDKLQSQLSGWS